MLLVIPVGLVAIASGTGIIRLPLEMFLLSERLPVIFKFHMVTSAGALMLAPVVIALRNRPSIHRMLGRLLGAFVVAGGLSALPVAIFSSSNAIARAGFFAQGLVWLTLLTAGIHAIRHGNRGRHARLMLAMVAVTSGAVWFRVFTGLAIFLQLPFEPVYAVSAWLGWIIPLAIVWSAPQIATAFLVRLPLDPSLPSPSQH